MCPELLRTATARAAAEKLSAGGVPTVETSRDVYETLSEKENPQGIGIVAKRRLTNLTDIDVSRGLCRVALLRPQDPGNVGTIIRTCDAVGSPGIILVDSAVDPYDPRSVRASMGSIFNTEVSWVTAGDFTEWSRRTGCHIVGTSDDAPTDFRSLTYRRPLVLLMGSEREGLFGHDLATDMVSIPMRGKADSLNLAVATGIVLYEVSRQLTAA